MKIVYGNIFKTGADVLVNPVNCMGTMGAGLARQFKNKYPEIYYPYKEACKKGDLKIGSLNSLYVHRYNIWVINFPTKNDWKENSKIEYIETGLKNLVEFISNFSNHKEMGFESVAIPALGCGLGGLNWSDVKKVIEEELSPEKVGDVEIIVVLDIGKE
jgi:O-acetyl-ADP-ribose deacetylase (regulator of RNase III)